MGKDALLGANRPKHKRGPNGIQWAKAHKIDPQRDARRRVYELPTVEIAIKSKISTDTKRQADRVFANLQKNAVLGRYKLPEKKRFWQKVFHAFKRAHFYGAAVMHSRRKDRSWSRLDQQVIDAAVGAGYAKETRSKPGSPKMSRLEPTESLIEIFGTDPWQRDPDLDTRLVFLYERGGEDREIPFDPADAVAAKVQRCLKRVNQTNATYGTTYRRYDRRIGRFAERCVLRPVHFAVFTDSFDLHGRIYTGKGGHQGLLRVERDTIKFGDQESVELDFGSMHVRMCYHLEGIGYAGDPYRLWGSRTSDDARLMAKTAANTMLNAADSESAVRACNQRMSIWTPAGTRKSGKSLRDARELYDASRRTGLKFADIVSLILEKHHRIAHWFSGDSGLKLMRIDSEIALRVLHWFGKRGIPCLGCHDSFIVPTVHQARLIRVMDGCYFRRLGHHPKIK
jgi:hypothetical protein